MRDNYSQVFGDLEKERATSMQGIITFMTSQEEVGEPVRNGLGER